MYYIKWIYLLWLSLERNVKILKATIFDGKPKKGFYIFEDSNGQIGWFEMMGSREPEIDEVFVGNFNNLGGEIIYSVASNEILRVFIQDIQCSMKRLERWCCQSIELER